MTRTRCDAQTQKLAYCSLDIWTEILVNLHQHHWSWAQVQSAETWPVGGKDISFCTPPIGLSPVVSDVQSYLWSEAPWKKSLSIISIGLTHFNLNTKAPLWYTRHLKITSRVIKSFGTYLRQFANATRAHKARISFIVLSVMLSLHSNTYCTPRDFSFYIYSYHVSYHKLVYPPDLNTQCAKNSHLSLT